MICKSGLDGNRPQPRYHIQVVGGRIVLVLGATNGPRSERMSRNDAVLITLYMIPGTWVGVVYNDESI